MAFKLKNMLKLLAAVCCWWALSPSAHAKSVEQLLQYAIEISPEVATAKAQMQVAQADLKISEAAWLPQASARLYNGVGDTKQSNPFANQRNANENIQNNSISLQQSIYNKPASIQIEQTQLTVQEAELRHALAVQTTIQNWLAKLMDYKQSKALLNLTEHKQQTALLQKEHVEQGVMNGENSALELANAESEAALRQAEHGQAEQAVKQRLWELSQLTGQEVVPVWVDDIEFNIPPTLHNEKELEQEVLQNNLGLKIQQLYKQAATLEINKANGQHHPTLKLVAQYSQSQSETVSTLGNRVEQNMLAIQMDIPLFNGFATQAQTEKAAASLNQQHADYNKTSAQVLRDTQAAHRQLNSATHLWKAYTQADRAATQQQLAIETAIKHQLATPLDLAKAKEKLTELQMKKMEYLRAANKAYLLVHELTGKLNIEGALERLSKRE
ncbi:TolC family protein [Limnobacter profundi]|uniref:TolC family protein n=1 Tax=Limnobacter profundi TaxID=2732163 RepID=A0ABX6N739_9BURK|nr:TolC family protein [Limnobacter sp. SAORIC-580]QJR29841.1 TolC family protein [Limnobacter sp. SAORIC-580]